MKSIYMGGNRIFSVYDAESRAILEREASVCSVPVTKDEVLAEPQKFAKTEYIFSTWGMPVFTEDEIKTCFPSLKCVFYGAGSVQFFARPFLNCGVHIFSAWGANAVPVAEYTVAQIILANKGFYLNTRMIRSPEGRKQASAYASGLPGNYDTNVGIIGAGMIGRMVIERLKAYRLRVLVYDPFLSDERAAELGAVKVSLEEIFATCQVISNHVANLPETVGMFHYDLFRRMKDNAVFLNTGRGAQVVEADLIRVLEEKPRVTAVLDVTAPEPPVEGSPFYTLPNVFLTSHIAGSSGEEVARMGCYMVDQFRKYENGQPCEYEVSHEMLKTMA